MHAAAQRAIARGFKKARFSILNHKLISARLSPSLLGYIDHHHLRISTRQDSPPSAITISSLPSHLWPPPCLQISSDSHCAVFMAENRPQQKSKRQRALVVQNGEIGMLKNGRFQSHTNFCMEVVHCVQSPMGATPMFGFVFLVRSTDQVER